MAGLGWQWVLRLGCLAVIAGGLTACGGEQASAPATVLPAATMEVRETAVSSPAAPSSGDATLEATPLRGMASGTPVGEGNRDRLAADCAAYEAWRSDPKVQAALEKAALWPEVIAQGEKAAAGEAVDTAAMAQAFEQMAKLGQQLRESETEGDHAPLQLAGRAMGQTSRLAGGLSEGNLDAQAAAEAVTEAKAAIATYEEDAAARQASCG
jgi:hypothetical protein